MSLNGAPFSKAPARGPEIAHPTPRPQLNSPNIPSLASAFSLRTYLIIALQMVLKPPANVPYATAKTARRGRFEAKPQKRKIDAVVPAVEMAITVVTCSLSDRQPVPTAPMTDEALRRERTSVPDTGERPIERAYDGRKIEGRL